MILQTFPLELIPWVIFTSIFILIVGLSVSLVYVGIRSFYLRVKAREFTIGEKLFLCKTSDTIIRRGSTSWQFDGKEKWVIDCPVCKAWHEAEKLGGFL